MRIDDQCKYREGVVLDRPPKSKGKGGSYVNAGMRKVYVCVVCVCVYVCVCVCVCVNVCVHTYMLTVLFPTLHFCLFQDVCIDKTLKPGVRVTVKLQSSHHSSQFSVFANILCLFSGYANH